MEPDGRINTRLRNVFRPLSAHTPGDKDSQSSAFLQTGQKTESNSRPWTAQPKSRSEMSPRRIPRQHLRKSHMRAPGKKLTGIEGHIDAVSSLNASALSHDDVLTLVSGKLEKHKDTSDQHTSSEQSQRTRHPSFENWVDGSPHNSDEYDTDIEEEKKPGRSSLGNGSITDLFPMRSSPYKHQIKRSGLLPDPTGIITYEEQCRKNGCVPISYLLRNLGKRNIRMRHHYLGGLATKPVAAALKRNTVTENVDFGDNCVEAAGAYYLANMLKDNMFVVSMNLSNNFIRSGGAAAFASMLEVNTTLKTLSLAGNQLQDPDAYGFIEALKNNMSLTSLDLSNNEFGERAGEMLGAALSVNDGLTDVDLSWNAIRNKGAVAISKALKTNATLEVLDVAWNGFGLQGAEALQQALQVNTTLKVLDLTNNRINNQAAQKLAVGIKKNFGLETLVLNLNPLGDEGVAAILKAVETHESLRFLSLEELAINAANFRMIQNLEETKNIIILHGGVGGYQRNTALASVLRLFTMFTREHHGHLETAFRQQDKDKSGILTPDEMKLTLREAGLRLTSRQLDLLITEIDYSHTGNIRYKDILNGKAFSDYHKRRPSRGIRLSSKGSSPMMLSSVGRQVTVS